MALAWYDFRRSEHLFLAADRLFPAASLVGLPILGLALRESHAGRLDLTKRLAIRLRDRAPGHGLLDTLRRGLHLTVQDLLTLMIAVGDPTATNRLIDLLGVDQINAFSRAIGLERTRLTGLLQQPVERQTEPQLAGDVDETSAADMLGFLLQLERGDLLPPAETVLAKQILFAQRDTAGLGRYLPLDATAFEQPVQLAAASGRLPGVRNDAGLVYDAMGSPRYALVVMTAHAKDRAAHVEQEGTMLVAEIAQALCAVPAGRAS